MTETISTQRAAIEHLLRTENPDAKLVLAACEAILRAGEAERAIPLLQKMRAKNPSNENISILLAHALRLDQQLGAAHALFSEAADNNLDAQFARAQTRADLGFPSATLYEKLFARAPENLEILRHQAASLSSEGEASKAQEILHAALSKNPGWLEGHKALSTLRWTGGDTMHFADSYAAACAAEPKNTDLWLAWFRAIAQTRNWPAALDILARAGKKIGDMPALQVSRLFVACEAQDDKIAHGLLAQTQHISGDVINLCRVRHYLRHRQYAEAATVALQQVITPSAPLFWPYLSLAWRMMGDHRAEWIDRPAQLIQSRAVEISLAELQELGSLLRHLHTARAPYIEQSVRGGTQTDRSVLLRHELILAHTREKLLAAIREYIADLPPHEQGHPLLGLPRSQLHLDGSWSVRLLAQGYNVPHTHAMGWLSTAFYVSLPQLSQSPAGHIAFGTPPVDLALDLPPYCTIKPQVGHLAVFPSTMWHSTVPFEDGERLVIAFDIRRPKY